MHVSTQLSGGTEAPLYNGEPFAKAMRSSYIYLFKGDMADLRVERDEGAGFEITTINVLRRERLTHPEKFAAYMLSDIVTGMLSYIEKM